MRARDTSFLPRRHFLKNLGAVATTFCLPDFASLGAVRRPRPQVVAIYCPLWHRYDHMDAWHGYGWTEWELLKTAPARFPGHYQPLHPSWGYFDESDSHWAAREVALAADHGIDVFLFDWYWYSGVRLMEEALENAFLKAPNRKRLKFALMWANHDWADYFPAPYDKPWNSWLPLRHSAADLSRLFDYCIAHYFHQPNYWKFDGRLFFSVFQPGKLLNELGGPAEVRSLLSRLDQKLRRAGLPAVHWNAMTTDPRLSARCQKAGFHSTTAYNIVSTGKNSTNLTQDYDDLIATHEKAWTSMSNAPLPNFPIVTMGWDVTPRCEHNVPWPFAKNDYPYTHAVLGNTPEGFARLCQKARDFVTLDPKHPSAVFINAWNEWTEGSYLLPEEKYGSAYLAEIERIFAP